jgi:hypothetical protein
MTVDHQKHPEITLKRECHQYLIKNQISNQKFRSAGLPKGKTVKKTQRVATNLAQEVEVGREKRARQTPRWRNHKCITKVN